MIWRWFWREWRTPALLIVWLSLTMAVACVLALGRIGDRIDQSVNNQSRDFLAGDLVLRSSHSVDPKWLEQAAKDNLTLSQQLSFTTMTYAADVPQLAQVKATDANYPLYGELITEPPNLKPQAGQVLISPRLIELLNVKVGDNLDVGDATLRIAGLLIQEPDSGFNPFQIAPRILISQHDIDATGAVQPGSRLTYRYMFKGEPADIERYQALITPQLNAAQRWYTVKQDSGALAKSMDTAQQFLVLSTLLTLLLAISAVAVAMTHYCRSRHKLIAVLKTLGAGRRELRIWVLGQWLVLIAAALAVGSVLGLIFESLLIRILAPLLPKILPEAGFWPWVWALGAVFVITVMVGIRPYRQLIATQPTRVLRNDVIAPIWPLKYYLPIMGTIVVVGLVLLTGSNPLLWALLGGILAVSLILAIIGFGGLWLLNKMSISNLSLRLAVNRLLRQPTQTLIQLSAFSLSFMLLAILLMVRGDLLERWQQQLPVDSPNYFLMNMTQNQIPEINQLMQSHAVKPSEFYPVILGRLTQINQQSAIEYSDLVNKGSNTVRRELNLTWDKQAQLPPFNDLIAGEWPPQKGTVSIEQNIVDEFNLSVGDTLTFMIDTQETIVTVSSIRKADWESLRPNFYFIFNQTDLEKHPAMWLSSFYYQGDGALLTQINRQYPTVSILDTGSLIKQIQSILSQVSRAIELMVILVLVCGALLLLAQIQVGMHQRQTELVVYRTLGASKKLLRRTLWNEFALLGAMAGLAAAIGAELALGLLQTYVFNFPWQPDWRMWLLLPLCAALLLSLCSSILGLRLLKDSGQYRRLQS